jgi:hypothetical protein
MIPHSEQAFFAFPQSFGRPVQGRPDFAFLRPLKPTVVFESYWRFAVERQNVFFRRIRGSPAPWTSDPVLRVHKFTNAYRASDRVSQYLIKHVIYAGDCSPRETLFRILLFKLFNKIETWEFLKSSLGFPTTTGFEPNRYSSVLNRWMAAGNTIYSGAYIMPSGGRSSEHTRKHEMHLHLLHKILGSGFAERLAEAKSLSKVFEMLREWPTFGDFLAFQYSIDLNYSELLNFDENDFVVAGPGAKDGIRKCFSHLGGMSESDVIRLVTDRQADCLSAVGLSFPSLWGRPLKLIDCQNLFCEISKYARLVHPEFSGISGRTRIKQKFRPSSNPLTVWYPPKWGIKVSLQVPVLDPAIEADAK